MTLEEIKSGDDWGSRAIFLGKCDKCGREVRVLTQEDDCPEYGTIVYVEHCPGEYVRFDLPVN